MNWIIRSPERVVRRQYHELRRLSSSSVSLFDTVSLSQRQPLFNIQVKRLKNTALIWNHHNYYNYQLKRNPMIILSQILDSDDFLNHRSNNRSNRISTKTYTTTTSTKSFGQSSLLLNNKYHYILSNNHNIKLNIHHSQQPNCYHQQHQQLSVRNSSSNTTSWTILPDFLQDISIWGGSGYLLKFFHHGNNPIVQSGSADGTTVMIEYIPYWGCFIAISLLVRTILIPVVIYGAKTSYRFSKIIPEVQFLLSLFQNDMKQLHNKLTLSKTKNDTDTTTKIINKERWQLMKMNFKTMSGLYQLHNIKPYAIFLSPILQLPFFYYISIDLRKIVNGLDPLLAQSLVDSSLLWIHDLTEPDMYYSLPILCGIIMYINIETSIGRRNLVGVNDPTKLISTPLLLKDIFQSVAILMPCFTCQLSSGVQLYILSSFIFTAIQSIALRNDTVRNSIGLPSVPIPSSSTPIEAPKYAKQFIELKQLEEQARKIRGDGPILGQHGILAHNYEVSFPGRYRRSTIQINNNNNMMIGSNLDTNTQGTPGNTTKVQLQIQLLPKHIQDMTYVHGISAPITQLVQQFSVDDESKQIIHSGGDDINKNKEATKGSIDNMKSSATTTNNVLSMKRFIKKNNNNKSSNSKKKGKK